jgi:hypothetical protein
MKVVNHTRWRTDHLARFMRTVALSELDAAKRRGFTMVVKYNRAGANGTYCSGRAAIGGRRITVMVPSGTVDRIDLAMVIAHEMAHARGMDHSAMRGAERYHRVGAWRDFYAWAERVPLEPTPAKAPVPLAAKRVTRLEHARTKLAEWERAVKRAETHRRKWSRRVKDLEWTIVKAEAAMTPKRGAS